MYRLVIVDDERKILDGIRDIFPWKEIGFEVVGSFTNGKDVLNFVEREQPDVVLTDIRMPDMDGLELTRRLQVYSNLRVVIFSSYAEYKYMREALKLNVTDYLLKPINYSDLLNCFGKIKEELDEEGRSAQPEEGSYYENMVAMVDSYLEKDFQRASLSEAAEQVGISASYLSRIYKEHKGIGFMERLNSIRMKKAGEMLMNPTFKGYEIAYLVGYDSPKNFTRAFKSYYHVTPRDYRNGIRAEQGAGEC